MVGTCRDVFYALLGVEWMITLVEREEQKQLLLALCAKDCFGCKISAVVKAYGFDKGFACFWLNEETRTVFCLADDVMLISGAIGDAEEARQFLQMLGVKTVHCSGENGEKLGWTTVESGEVLEKTAPAGEAVPATAEEVPIRELFSLLEEVGMVEEFEPFYLDLSHRLRHGASRAFWVRKEEKVAACAIVSAIGEKAVILSAVAVREDCRRQGLGRQLVGQVEEAFPGDAIYVFREQGRHQEFYGGLGYAPIGTWVTVER